MLDHDLPTDVDDYGPLITWREALIVLAFTLVIVGAAVLTLVGVLR